MIRKVAFFKNVRSIFIPESLSDFDKYIFLERHRAKKSKIISSFVEPFKCTCDHIVPKSFSGNDNATNLMPMHDFCNSLRRNLSWATLVNEGYTTTDNIDRFLDNMSLAITQKEVVFEKQRQYVNTVRGSLNWLLARTEGQ